MSPTRVDAPTFEHHRAAFGIGEACPRLSWKIRTDAPDWVQKAYEISVTPTAGGPPWLSGRVASDESVLVPWEAPPLLPHERRTVRVRVWGPRDSEPCAWSPPATVEAGLPTDGDITADFITPDWTSDTSTAQPAALLRRDFVLMTEVASARLYVTALGAYDAEINGIGVGDQVPASGWPDHQEIRYRTFDVTHLLQPGANAIGAWLGHGWYRGSRGGLGGGRRSINGEHLGLWGQLEVSYADGGVETITTDGRWRAHRAPITASDLHDGESHDARLEIHDWSRPGLDERAWSGVRVLEAPPGRFVGPTGPPLRRIGELRPAGITTSPSGRTVVDFGRSLVGRLRISVRGQAGHTVVLRHDEAMDTGEFGLRALGTAQATDIYTLRGGGMEVWEPRFAVHAFRYAELENWPGIPTVDDVTAVVLHTDMERTGWFACSDPRLEHLHEDAVWGMRGSFPNVPTDRSRHNDRLGVLDFAPASAWGDAGTVGDLLHRTVAGLAPAEPGYRRMRVAPKPGRGLTSAYAAHETPYGRAEVSWERNGAVLTVRVLVPPNTTAVVELPDLNDPFEIGSGEHTFLAGCRAPEEDPDSDPTALDHALALHMAQPQALQQ